MKVNTDFTIDGLMTIAPTIHKDPRGYFYEAYQSNRYRTLGLPEFVQDNVSYSTRGVFRGFHIQYCNTQAKLISCLRGSIIDYAIDLRYKSPTFGKWVSQLLSEENKLQFYIPEGFAHGFYTSSETAMLSYKASDYYSPKHDITIAYSDPSLEVYFPSSPVVSEKDSKGIHVKEYLEKYQLPISNPS